MKTNKQRAVTNTFYKACDEHRVLGDEYELAFGHIVFGRYPCFRKILTEKELNEKMLNISVTNWVNRYAELRDAE